MNSDNTMTVSVVMAVYNDTQYVQHAVDSILSQKNVNVELILVDDGSDAACEKTLQAIEKKDERIRLVRIAHGGLTVALNAGFKEARGKYIARLDADDVAEPDRLKRQVTFLETHPDIVLCGTQGWYINHDGKRIGEKDLPTAPEEIADRLLFNNQFIHSSWMIRRNWIEKNGSYDESFKKSQDYELVLRLVGAGEKVANLPERLVSWRVRPSSVSWASKAQEWYAIRARWRAITQYHFPFFSGIVHILIRLGWLCIPQRLKMKRYDA